MRRFLCLLLMLFLLIPWAHAEDPGSFVVVEDEDLLPPDSHLQARALMRSMTEEEKIFQLLIVTLEDLTGEAYTTALKDENVFTDRPVGGVVIYGQNIVSEDQLRSLVADVERQAKEAGAYPLFVGVHEAGGAVSRVANKLGYPAQPGMPELGAAGDTEAARETGRAIGSYLAPFGFNLDLALSLDMPVTEASKVENRSFGPDPDTVSRLAWAMAEGLGEEGVLSCFGHFPNDGSLEKKNYYGTASNRRTLNDLRARELRPYAAVIARGAEMVMVGNGVIRALGDDMPSSLSYAVIQGLLREELGFSGVVITESLRASAVTTYYKPGEAAVTALEAGADMIFLPADLDAAVKAVRDALRTGRITQERLDLSVERILALKIRAKIIQ